MEVSNLTPRPLSPPGRTPVRTEQGAGWAPGPVWKFPRREFSLKFVDTLLKQGVAAAADSSTFVISRRDWSAELRRTIWYELRLKVEHDRL